jgi:hypothetical protein
MRHILECSSIVLFPSTDHLHFQSTAFFRSEDVMKACCFQSHCGCTRAGTRTPQRSHCRAVLFCLLSRVQAFGVERIATRGTYIWLSVFGNIFGKLYKYIDHVVSFCQYFWKGITYRYCRFVVALHLLYCTAV